MELGWIVVVVALGVAVAIEMTLILVILRAIAQLQEVVSETAGGWQRGIPVGSELPDLMFSELFSGERTSTKSLWEPHGLVVVFASIGCVPCRDLLKRMVRVNTASGSLLRPIAVLVAGNANLARYLVEDAGLKAMGGMVTVGLVDQPRVETLGVIGTPTTVRVGMNGIVEGSWLGEMDEAQVRHVLS